MSKRPTPSTQHETPTKLRRRIQNVVFAALYRCGGRIYDPLTRLLFGGAWDRWRTIVISDLPPGRILDLGCGTGSLVNRLNSKGYVAFGVDRESSILRRARSLAGSQNHVVRGDATKLPFRTAAFDACVSTFPSRFILQPATLNEIARVVRCGGLVAIVLSGYTDDWPFYRRPFRLALRLFYGEHDLNRHDLPPSNLISHPDLDGAWRWIARGPDHVVVWIGQRTNDSSW